MLGNVCFRAGKEEPHADSGATVRNAEPEDLPPVDNPTLESLTNLTGVPMPGISAEGKARALDEALDWLRNNDPDVNKVDEPGLNKLSNLGGIPMPKKLTPEAKQKTLDDVLDWIRSNDVTPGEVDEPTLKALTNLAGVTTLSPREAKRKANG